MIRSFLIASVSSLALISAAAAADLPTVKGPPPFVPPPPPPPFSWTGFYFGINGGYGGDRFAYPFALGPVGPLSATGSFTETSGGFLGGGQVGVNYQMPGNNVVVGLEADADATSIRGQVGFNATAPALGTVSAAAGSHINFIGTVRGRLGYAFDRVMPYITGGFAYGSVSDYGNITGAGVFPFALGASQTNTRTGWTVGAGLEYAITNNLTFKTEYLYMDLGQATLFNGAVLGAVPVFLGERTTTHIVRAGLNWKFDWAPPPAPVVAKY